MDGTCEGLRLYPYNGGNIQEGTQERGQTGDGRMGEDCRGGHVEDTARGSLLSVRLRLTVASQGSLDQVT